MSAWLRKKNKLHFCKNNNKNGAGSQRKIISKFCKVLDISALIS